MCNCTYPLVTGGAFALEDKYQYNGIELNTDFGLLVNEARFRTLDAQLGRWWQIDPEVEQFEAWSPYNSNLDNPIRYDDPEGDCADCPPDITVGGLLETAFYDMTHSLFNVAAYGVQLATGSEGRYVADYPTNGSGTPIFGTDVQYVTNETQGQKALNLLGDALQVTSLANGGLSSMAMVETPNQSKQTVKAVQHLNSNDATGNFSIYEIKIDGQTHKFGKADEARVTKSSGQPTRLHQQVRQLKKENPQKIVRGEVVKKLGTATTKQAKEVEHKTIQSFFDTYGFVPQGNQNSFKPKK